VHIRRVAGTRSGWTCERRARQADIIRRTRPWTRSTGPKSAAGKKRSSQNALRFLTDPEARLAYDLTQQFLSTGIVPPALGELWVAAYLNPVGDNFYDDLLGFREWRRCPLDDAAVADLLDVALDYLPDDGDGDAWLYDIDRHGDDA
jgi:hypothetical protein